MVYILVPASRRARRLRGDLLIIRRARFAERVSVGAHRRRVPLELVEHALQRLAVGAVGVAQRAVVAERLPRARELPRRRDGQAAESDKNGRSATPARAPPQLPAEYVAMPAGLCAKSDEPKCDMTLTRPGASV